MSYSMTNVMSLPVSEHSGCRAHGSGNQGFRVQVSGFRVQGSGFGVQGSGFRVQGSGFDVQGSGFKVRGTDSEVSNPEFETLGMQYRRVSFSGDVVLHHQRHVLSCGRGLSRPFGP